MIPLSATIVAVADGFDAMTSRRPYKGPWPPIRAMREIAKGRGKRYSPQVVDAFQRAVEKGEIGRIAAVRHTKLSDLTRAA
jgi:HD-GYP domain-containing protein (c-di-GMP phosphodiesterase class II)